MISDVLSDAVVAIQEYLDHEGTRDCYQGEIRTRIHRLMGEMTEMRVVLDAPPGVDPGRPKELLDCGHYVWEHGPRGRCQA